MNDAMNLKNIAAALVYSALGLAVLMAAFLAVDRCTPYNLWHEIVEKQNRALAIVVGSITLGISFIIGMAIIG